MKSSKVYIDPSSNIPYSSFYIKGLYGVFGRKNVSFSTHYFKTLQKRADDYSFDAYMAIVIVSRERINRIIIDFGDGSPIRKNAFEWCDVYAKINIETHVLQPHHHHKMLSITPSFGIKVWNVFEAAYYALSNLIMLRFRPQISPVNHMKSYLSQVRQLRIKDFTERNTYSVHHNGDSVFFVSSLWPHPNCLTGTNLYRKMFIERCIENEIKFEGGFWVSDTNHPQFTDFKHLVFNRRYPLKKYVQKTKRSAFVFNTPAVHNCHGWKLGQFLAMGKAIISTPFLNTLPTGMRHGENIHFVLSENAMKEAVLLLSTDRVYRRKLEAGAKHYYEKYAKPEAVIEQILSKINFRK